MRDNSFTTQLLDALKVRNYDDRGAKIGDRVRDRASASLEAMTLSKDRWVLRNTLPNMRKPEVFFGK